MIWSQIEKYDRNHLLRLMDKGKSYSYSQIKGICEKDLGLKDSTIKMKLSRLIKEGRIEKDKDNNYKLTGK